MMDGEDKWRPVSEVAAEWFVRLKDGELTADERREYLAWLKKSPENIAQMLHVSHTFGVLRCAFKGTKTEVLIPEEDTSNIIDMATRGLVSSRRVDRINAHRGKIAAAFTMIVLTSLLALIVKSAVFDRTIETEAGEWRDVSLADGSMMRLGPRTRVSIEFGDQQRLVHLQGGEAYFEVKKDLARPFIVNAEPVDVRAVGTAFSVSRYNNKVTVTVKEGAVALTQSGRTEIRTVSNGVQKNTVESVPLSAGQKVSVSRSWPVRAQRVDVDRELAWIHKRFIFDSSVDTVRNAVEEYNRRNSVLFVLEDPTLATKPMSGVFVATDPESLVRYLEINTQVVVLRDRPGVVRLASPGKAP